MILQVNADRGGKVVTINCDNQQSKSLKQAQQSQSTINNPPEAKTDLTRQSQSTINCDSGEHNNQQSTIFAFEPQKRLQWTINNRQSTIRALKVPTPGQPAAPAPARQPAGGDTRQPGRQPASQEAGLLWWTVRSPSYLFSPRAW
jgi:hypothetical protein